MPDDTPVTPIQPQPQPKEPPKPGYKSTEFWLTLAVIVLGAVIGSGLLATDGAAIKVCGIVASVLAQLGYGAMRTSAKKGG